ncbi:MAG: hypothetical protein SFU27_07990, partial [Thermonemataceae bacterium]|nr:hypothetical protein [Thermonemataceae bacterium]
MKSTFIWIFLLIIVFVINAIFWLYSYENTINYLWVTLTLKESQKVKLKELLTAEKLILLKVLFSVFSGIFILLLFVFRKKYNLVRQAFDKIIVYAHQFSKAFKNLSKKQKVWLVVYFFVLICWQSIKLNNSILHIDEAFSFVHFAHKGFWVSVLYYPNPNNHIFYNVLVSQVHYLFASKFLAIKIISVMAFFITNILFFRYLLSRYSFIWALG